MNLNLQTHRGLAALGFCAALGAYAVSHSAPPARNAAAAVPISAAINVTAASLKVRAAHKPERCETDAKAAVRVERRTMPERKAVAIDAAR